MLRVVPNEGFLHTKINNKDIYVAGSNKNIQKTSICSNKNTQKKLHNVTYILDENTLVCYPFLLLFLKGRIKFPKKWVGGEIFLRKSVGEAKMGWDFSFSFSHY